MRSREIKMNALYDCEGVICRAKKQLKNGRFLVTHHKSFHSIVEPVKLKRIGAKRIQSYLREVGVDI